MPTYFIVTSVRLRGFFGPKKSAIKFETKRTRPAELGTTPWDDQVGLTQYTIFYVAPPEGSRTFEHI